MPGAESTEVARLEVGAEMLELIERNFLEAEANARAMREPKLMHQLMSAANTILNAYKKGGCLFVAGNGGSAADAQHLVAELVSKLYRDRTPIKAFAMTVDTSILTAIGNDYGYEHSFERQVRGLMGPADVFFAITTSGNSKNILMALEACRQMGIDSVLLSGATGGKAATLATQCILAPGARTDRVQESHLVIYHTLCQLIENGLIEMGLCHYKDMQNA